MRLFKNKWFHGVGGGVSVMHLMNATASTVAWIGLATPSTKKNIRNWFGAPWYIRFKKGALQYVYENSSHDLFCGDQ